MLKSQLCKESDFRQEWYQNCLIKIKEPFKYHRKQWEYCYIYQTLLERGLLMPGKRGLGFGVGKEPLASVFASHGCEILATDLDSTSANSFGWNATCLKDLNEREICDPEQFNKLVTFKCLNMNNISPDYFDSFDFTWSSCAFEHLGSISSGLQFVINQLQCLGPGGVSVHTTEYNLSSDKDTLEAKNLVLFRNQDIRRLEKKIMESGCSIDIDYSVGKGDIESNIDVPPYREDPHIRLLIGKHTCTSIGLIIIKTG